MKTKISRYFVFFKILATGEEPCDPPCLSNQVCQNYSGFPECICKEGFTGEDTCEGIKIETAYAQILDVSVTCKERFCRVFGLTVEFSVLL